MALEVVSLASVLWAFNVVSVGRSCCLRCPSLLSVHAVSASNHAVMFLSFCPHCVYISLCLSFSLFLSSLPFPPLSHSLSSSLALSLSLCLALSLSFLARTVSPWRGVWRCVRKSNECEGTKDKQKRLTHRIQQRASTRMRQLKSRSRFPQTSDSSKFVRHSHGVQLKTG